MLLFDATHTSHTRARTGIQRVCRSLYSALAAAEPVTALCFDPHQDAWRPLDRGEQALLDRRTDGPAAGSRGSRWSLAQRLSGHARRLAGRRRVLPTAEGLVCPELFSARVGRRLTELFPRVIGPRIAIFHDAIGLRYPEFTPPATVARLPAYLQELRHFDGIAAVSEESAETLRSYWRWLGTPPGPPIRAIPLGIDAMPSPAADEEAGDGPPRVLCVATIEGRKNHLALLDAAESLWREGVSFTLELVGMPRVDTAAIALERIQSLRRSGRPLVAHGSVTEHGLRSAYARCAFTIYPSLAEGFGLPVLESLQAGKPCICSGRGALGESARGGGCVELDSVDASTLRAALRHLLQDAAARNALAGAARLRRFRSWTDYARDLRAWMHELHPPL